MKHSDMTRAFSIARKEIKGKRFSSTEISAILMRSKELATRKSKIDEILEFLEE